MFPRVTEARHLHDYELEVRFADGTVATLDFSKRIVGRGALFAALLDVAFFRQVAVDDEAGTLVWPNGVDFCPDVLYAEATGKPIADMRKELEVV